MSPATNGLPETNTPSTAMENVGLVSLVTLSEFETPLSLADFRSGEPGVPGTRLSTTTVNDEVEDAELPASCAFAVNAYDPSSSGPTENWWVPAVTSLSVRVRALRMAPDPSSSVSN